MLEHPVKKCDILINTQDGTEDGSEWKNQTPEALNRVTPKSQSLDGDKFRNALTTFSLL